MDLRCVLWDFGDTLIDERWMLVAPPNAPDWPNAWSEIATGSLADAWNLGQLRAEQVEQAVGERVAMSQEAVGAHMLGCLANLTLFELPHAVVRASPLRWGSSPSNGWAAGDLHRPDREYLPGWRRGRQVMRARHEVMQVTKEARAMAAKKTARKKTPAARKKGTQKKTTRKVAPAKSALGEELPRSLKAFGRQLRRDLNAIEREIESARKDARRSLTRIVRDASHQLGALEARGQREWRALSKRAERELDVLVRRVRKAAKR